MKKYIFLIFILSTLLATLKANEDDYYYDDDDQNEKTTDGTEDIKPSQPLPTNTTQITYNVNPLLPVA